MSRKKDFNKMKLVADYRLKGYSFRAIAKIIKSDVKTVYRWHKYNQNRPVDNYVGNK